MYIYSKSCLNYFKQWIQQGNSGGIKILGRLKIKRYNIRLNYNREKSGKNKQGNNDYNNNNNSGNNNIGKNNNKDKWGGRGRGIKL